MLDIGTVGHKVKAEPMRLYSVALEEGPPAKGSS